MFMSLFLIKPIKVTLETTNHYICIGAKCPKSIINFKNVIPSAFYSMTFYISILRHFLLENRLYSYKK